MSVAKNCIVKPNCIVPNCMLGNRCREDCRGGEFFLKTGCCCHSLNNQVEKQSVTSRGSKSIENGTSILPKGSPELQHEKLHQVDNRNDLVKPLASRQSRNSSMIRSMQGSLRNGASKNTEIRRESNIDSYLSSSVEQSDSSVIRAMEDEDATSEDIRNRVKKRQIASMERMTKKVEAGSREDDTEILDSESVNEFNSLIRNNTILSPRESSSSVQDLGTVFSDDNWHEYKARSMASQAKVSGPPIGTTDDRNGSSNLFPNRSFRSDNAVIIRIESLTLDHKCQLLEDPEVHQLYVEFSFLGYHGVDLETMSVPKPSANATAYFNYMRKFEIDEEDHQMQRSIMRAMMTDDDNPTVKFTVVSEPLPSEMEIKECMEVGYAYLNIRDHVLSGGSNQVPLTIVNLKQTEPIGILKITLLGAEVIRRCMSDLV